MAKDVKDIKESTLEFALRIIKLCQHLDKKPGVSRTLVANCRRRERQSEPMLKRPRLVRADPISSARTPSP
jgi:hypothetical protein